MATTPSTIEPPDMSKALSRRELFRAGLAGTAMWSLTRRSVAASRRQASGDSPRRPWLLTSASDLRPAAPPAPSQAEVDDLVALQAGRTDGTHEMVDRWGDRPAVLPWTDVTLELIKEFKPSPPRAARALALVHVAMADAVTAAEDAREAFPRPAPATVIAGLDPIAPGHAASFPSEHAAVASAASIILAHLFPMAAARLDGFAREAGDSRLAAGANYRSDVTAGAAIGQGVGRLAVAWAKEDGSDAVWDGARPTGEGMWQPTPPDLRPDPLEPMAGGWATWVLDEGSALRPPPPPSWGSDAWWAELAAVQAAVSERTPEHEAAVLRWAGGPGTVTPAGLWVEIARDLALAERLDLEKTAATMVLTTVAMHDAFVCCWDAKFAYWTARPITADPYIDVLIPTPPFPSYTSGHSTSSAAATILGHLFPSHATRMDARAAEAKDSRLWAGIHFPFDNETGATGGERIARMVIAARP